MPDSTSLIVHKFLVQMKVIYLPTFLKSLKNTDHAAITNELLFYDQLVYVRLTFQHMLLSLVNFNFRTY